MITYGFVFENSSPNDVDGDDESKKKMSLVWNQRDDWLVAAVKAKQSPDLFDVKSKEINSIERKEEREANHTLKF